MTRRSVPTKKLAEDRYHWRVDIEVPPDGLGPRLNAMHDWCRERKVDWAQHGYLEAMRDFARFYFMAEAAAVAFRERWGGEVMLQAVGSV